MKERCRHSSVGRSEELSVRGSASVLYILDFDLFFLPTKLNTHGSSVVAHRCACTSISLSGHQLPPYTDASRPTDFVSGKQLYVVV